MACFRFLIPSSIETRCEKESLGGWDLCPGVAGSSALSYSLGEEKYMSEEELRAELERLRAENDQLKNKGVRGLSLKVSEKGGLSLYGVGRFPVTLYKEQWRKILGMAAEIEEFMQKNESLLKTKE
jgi:hypothetical protein